MKCYQTIVSGGRNPNPLSPTPTPSLTGPSPANPSSPATNTLTVSPANPTQEITRAQLASQLLRALLASERDPSASAFARFVARFGIDAEWSPVPIPGRAHALEASQINLLLAKIETGVPIHQALTENHLSINQSLKLPSKCVVFNFHFI